MNPENLTIQEIFSESVSKFSQKIALQIKIGNQWQRLTYKDVETRALKVATFLFREGLKKGDFAAILLEGRPEWAIIYLGIMYAGLTCVPLDHQASVEEIKNIILDSKTKILFCSHQIHTKKISQDIQQLLSKIIIVDLKEPQARNRLSFGEIEKITPEENLSIPTEPQDIASLIYTSGTTDQPKGVLLTHKNICSNFMSISQLNFCLPSDNFISLLPLHHTYPFMVTLIVPLLYGATVTFSPLVFRPQDLIGLIKESGVTILVGVPQLFSLIHSTISKKIKRIPFLLKPFFLPLVRRKIRHSFGRKLRVLVSGGARLEPGIAQDLSRWGLKIIEGYGLTETSPVATLNPPQRVKFGSAGKAIPEVQIKIDRPDNLGVGEVLIKGPNVMKGYFNQAELTSTVIKEGWFYSGDLGYIDKDGYLFITGREKEVIVLSSGKNIYPEELEAYYSQSPYIKEICILQKREERFGHFVESLYAAVVPDLDYFRQKNETNIQGKVRWEMENLARNLPAYKHIMGFTLTKEELPRTALRKIQRYKAKEKYLEAEPSKLYIEGGELSEEDKRILSQDIAKKIISYISRQLKKPVYLDNHLEIDLGIDSLTKVELGLGLEALLSVHIPPEALSSVSTVKDVIIKMEEIIAKKKQPGVYEIQETGKTWGQILKEASEKEILKKIKIEIALLDWLSTWILKKIFLPIFRTFWFLKIEGKEHLPKRGPYLVCPNHASYLDGFVVFCSLPLKLAVKTYFLGYSAVFDHPLVRWAQRLARLIPVDSNVNLTEAMQAVAVTLSHRKIICIFPEGRRSIDEHVGEFRKGVGILIKEMAIPVVPVYIKGSHQSWPRGSRFPRPYPLKIIFGQPFSKEELIKKGKKESTVDDYEAIALGLREEVIKLAC